MADATPPANGTAPTPSRGAGGMRGSGGRGAPNGGPMRGRGGFVPR